MEKKVSKLKYNRTSLKKQIFSLAGVLMVFLLSNYSLGQKDFYMKEKELYEKYKMSVKHFEKGKELFHKGDEKKAEKELHKCLKIFPRHTQAHFYLSNILYNRGDFDRALEHIEEAKANFEFMNQMYALAYDDYTTKLRGQRDESQKKLSEYQDKLAATTDQDTKRALEGTIASLESEISTLNNRLTEPLPTLKQIPADYFYLHGNILFKLKEHQEAQRQYLEAIRIDPTHGNAYNNLAIIYFMAKQYQTALELLNKAEENGAKVNPEFKKAILKALGK